MQMTVIPLLSSALKKNTKRMGGDPGPLGPPPGYAPVGFIPVHHGIILIIQSTTIAQDSTYCIENIIIKFVDLVKLGKSLSLKNISLKYAKGFSLCFSHVKKQLGKFENSNLNQATTFIYSLFLRSVALA